MIGILRTCLRQIRIGPSFLLVPLVSSASPSSKERIPFRLSIMYIFDSSLNHHLIFFRSYERKLMHFQHSPKFVSVYLAGWKKTRNRAGTWTEFLRIHSARSWNFFARPQNISAKPKIPYARCQSFRKIPKSFREGRTKFSGVNFSQPGTKYMIWSFLWPPPSREALISVADPLILTWIRIRILGSTFGYSESGSWSSDRPYGNNGSGSWSSGPPLEIVDPDPSP